MSGYSALDKILHRLALGLTPVAEMSFDMERRALNEAAKQAAGAGRHVFVSGLARAGTTVLMRRFHATGAFRSLTYRDMPFVLAPNAWRRLAGQRRTAVAGERAHGDDLVVNVDSPESLDEVFWRVFCGRGYIHADGLTPHVPDAETRAMFRDYVAAILSGSGHDRYLSKNNNSILRLGALAETFPAAMIVVPYRDPLSHAASLHRQHMRFSAMQAEDPFVRRYMGWLAHHEFGLDHRPFVFDGAGPEGDPATPDYWLSLWVRSYGWLSETAPTRARFVSYEALCTDPTVWRGLAEAAGVDPAIESDGGFRLSRQPVGQAFSEPLVREARAIYDILGDRMRAAA